jgi:hypothetical protein
MCFSSYLVFKGYQLCAGRISLLLPSQLCLYDAQLAVITAIISINRKIEIASFILIVFS